MEPSISEIEPLPEPEKPKFKPTLSGFGLPNFGVRRAIVEAQAIKHGFSVEWDSEDHGFVKNPPWEEFHTNPNGPRDTMINIGGAPNYYGFHESTRYVEHELNKELQSLIGKAEFQPANKLISGVQEQAISENDWSEALSKGIVTVGELHALELKPRKRLLGKWFCEGDLGFIYAFRGTGKTWLALAIASALSTGGKLGNWQAEAAVKVLFVDGEMPPDLMRARSEGLGATNDNLEILNHEILFDRTDRTINITGWEVQQAITAHCLQNAVKVLILDNLSTLACGMSENEADSWELVNNWLLGMRKRRVAVVIVHHAGRSGNMRGTSKREDNVFWVIGLQDMKEDAEDKKGVRFVSSFKKHSRNTQDEELPVEWHMVTDDETGLVSIDHKFSQSMEMFKRVIESGVVKPIEIAKVMGLPDYTISRMGKKAIDAGWLRKASRGEFAVVLEE
jgi:putative DNA primase/helicase